MPNAVQPAVGGLRFEVLAEIAVGTTARVDLCRTTAPAAGQLVAVKRLVAETAADPAISSRFLDEVWMTSALRHPNVVAVTGWGNDEEGPFLAVELVQGVSLARLMKTVFDTREEFPERLVVYVGACVLRGLAAAHELVSDRGEPLALVHRDLSVHNVLVGFNGDVKIADFGLARAKNRLTQTTSSLPSRAVGHLSPEELRGEEIDHRADLYSVGVMLYELLTGKPPFAGKDELDTARLILNAQTPDPIRVRPRIDMALAALVRRCLEKSPDKRFRSARDVGRELDGWLYAHGYRDDNAEALGRFVRRNAMRQMRWFERVISGQKEPTPHAQPTKIDVPVRAPSPSLSEGSASRDTETTVVDAAKKPKLPPRRARSSDAVPALKRRRDFVAEPTKREGYSASRGDSLDDLDEDEGEDIPTVAMKRGDHPAFRALMEAKAGAPGTIATGGATDTGSSEATDPRATMPLREVPEAPLQTRSRDEMQHLERPRREMPADERPTGRGDIEGDDGMIQDASSADVIELPDDPSTVTPPPRRIPPQAPIPQRPAAAAPAPRAPPQVPRPQAPRPLPPVHGFSRESAPPPRAPTHVIEPAYDASRAPAVLAEPTQPMSTHTLAPEYIQHQVERLRDDAAVKVAESRRLREIAERALRDAERAEAAARRAEHAASVAALAVRAAATEGMSAATARLEEAIAISEGNG